MNTIHEIEADKIFGYPPGQLDYFHARRFFKDMEFEHHAIMLPFPVGATTDYVLPFPANNQPHRGQFIKCIHLFHTRTSGIVDAWIQGQLWVNGQLAWGGVFSAFPMCVNMYLPPKAILTGYVRGIVAAAAGNPVYCRISIEVITFDPESDPYEYGENAKANPAAWPP